MYPTQHHQLLTVAIIKDILLVYRFTCIARTRLLRYDKSSDEESVRLQNSAQNSTGFEILTGVLGSGSEEVLA